MRQFLTILATAIIIASCEKQQKQIEKFVFDNKQISSKTIHRYEFYRDGKVKTDYSETFYLVAGATIDTVRSKEKFKYNSKGKVESIIDLLDSTKEFRVYDNVDSLITKIRINQFGDTTFLEKIDYKKGKQIKRVNRILQTKFPENPKDIKRMNFRNYDTLLDIEQFVYNGDVCEKMISIDKKENVTEEFQYIYDKGKHIRTLVYSFLGSTKYVKETTDYTYNEEKEPDYVTVGTQGDTVAVKKTFFRDDMRIVVDFFSRLNSQNIWYYNKKDQMIGMVSMNYSNNVKYVYSYSYDDKGNVLEVQNYNEMISNAH